MNKTRIDFNSKLASLNKGTSSCFVFRLRHCQRFTRDLACLSQAR
jgi:hypothetical protein